MIRVSQEPMRNKSIKIDTLEKPSSFSKKISSAKNIEHENKNTRKVMHEYFQRKLQNDANVDMKSSQNRTEEKYDKTLFWIIGMSNRSRNTSKQYLLQKEI